MASRTLFFRITYGNKSYPMKFSLATPTEKLFNEFFACAVTACGAVGVADLTLYASMGGSIVLGSDDAVRTFLEWIILHPQPVTQMGFIRAGESAAVFMKPQTSSPLTVDHAGSSGLDFSGFGSSGNERHIEVVVSEKVRTLLADSDSDCSVFPTDQADGPLSLSDSDDDMEECFGENVHEPLDVHCYGRRSSLSEEDGDMADVDELAFCFPGFDSAREHAGQFVKRVWEASWKATHFYSLPEWLQDNDFLHSGYRPPLPTFRACITSIFRVHNETGNIWSHMLGCAAFLGIAGFFLTRSSDEIQLQEKLVFSAFFAGAIACLGLSFAFHTVNCHSERVGRLFCKLDYVGITLLIVGSFIPWLFYCFYCRPQPKVGYSAAIVVLGIACVVVSLCDKFSEPPFRPVRAGMFFSLAVSGIIPSVHYLITDGYWSAVHEAHFGWLMLMALLYICGTVIYAMRIPERFFPGKFDIWFQSHQLFHLFVVIAAFVHYHGITEMAIMRLQGASCQERDYLRDSIML